MAGPSPELPEEPAEPDEFHHDRREHPGKLERLDDDQLARLAEEERVDAGLDDYDPGEVPPATDPLPEDVPRRTDVRQTEQYQEEEAEVRREGELGELPEISEENPFPPTRYDDV